MDCILNKILNLKAQPIEIGRNGHHFVKNQLKSRKNHPDFEWSGFQMVGTIAKAIAWALPFESGTIWNLTFRIPNISGLKLDFISEFHLTESPKKHSDTNRIKFRLSKYKDDLKAVRGRELCQHPLVQIEDECYFVAEEKSDWNQAHDKCTNLQAHLFEPR